MGSMPRALGLLALSPFVRHLRAPKATVDTGPPLLVLRELLEAGKLTPIIDRTYPLREVPEAIRHMTTGQARGKIVITP